MLVNIQYKHCYNFYIHYISKNVFFQQDAVVKSVSKDIYYDKQKISISNKFISNTSCERPIKES